MTKLPLGPPVRVNPSGLGSTHLAWFGPLGRTHFVSSPASKPRPLLSRDAVVACAFADLPWPSPAVSDDEIRRVRFAFRRCTRWSASIWDWRPPLLSPNPSATRFAWCSWRFAAPRRPWRCGDAVCLARLVLERLRSTDAWLGRGVALPWPGSVAVPPR
jgi:hypothetical protein